MREQLISFETAKLAKEKGFDEQTLNHYGIASQAIFKYDKWQDEEGFTICAPTQSLLQKWLREVHKIHIYVVPYGDKESWSLTNLRYTDINELSYSTKSNYECIKFSSYEEALEEGLNHALNLI